MPARCPGACRGLGGGTSSPWQMEAGEQRAKRPSLGVAAPVGGTGRACWGRAAAGAAFSGFQPAKATASPLRDPARTVTFPSSLSSFPSRLSAELGYLMSRCWAPGLQSWWRGRGLKRMWAPRAGGSEAGPPRAGVQKFQIPEGTYLPLQNINERKFSVIKTPSLKSCCWAPSNNLL